MTRYILRPDESGGLRYDGPHGPMLLDAEDHRTALDGPGGLRAELAWGRGRSPARGLPGEVALTLDGRALTITQGTARGRDGRAIRIADPERGTLVLVRKRRLARASLERPDGTPLGHTGIAAGPEGAVAPDATAEEIAILLLLQASGAISATDGGLGPLIPF